MSDVQIEYPVDQQNIIYHNIQYDQDELYYYDKIENTTLYN